MYRLQQSLTGSCHFLTNNSSPGLPRERCQNTLENSRETKKFSEHPEALILLKIKSIKCALSSPSSLNIVFFSELFKIFQTLFSLGVSVCTHIRQVENQRCSRTGRVQKILRKKHRIKWMNFFYLILWQHPCFAGI